MNIANLQSITMVESPCKCCGMVEPKEVHGPEWPWSRFFQTWAVTWAVTCGNCEREFARFSILPRPKCPYCGVRNKIKLWLVP